MNDELKFADEGGQAATPARAPWTLLIVDDEQEVHAVTTLALREFSFNGKGVRFLHAYSGAQAQRMLADHPEIALVLLDVVMETDQAGLDVVEYVRNQLKNPFVRIVLRTGQPGQAPELEVIRRYDINDYKHKTELTRERLFTTVYTGLSTYRDLMALDANRRGLEKVIDATAHILELRSLEHFAQGVLEQLTALLFIERGALVVQISGVAAESNGGLSILAGTGVYQALAGRDARSVLPADVLARIEAARVAQKTLYGADYFTGYEHHLIFDIGADQPISLPDRRLIELFLRNVGIARDNLRLLHERHAAG
ncbi:MAG TPA: DUF3369 domain-containing protein [Nevskiaceae bacterium]|nr:DUF3369 domain-containing protein [Nevskiaceae bacterium]